jgi:hypothetical protein
MGRSFSNRVVLIYEKTGLFSWLDAGILVDFALRGLYIKLVAKVAAIVVAGKESLMRISDKVMLTVGHVTSVDNKHDWMSGQTTITTRFRPTAYMARRPNGPIPNIEMLECAAGDCKAVVGVQVYSRRTAENKRAIRYAVASTLLASGVALFAFVFSGGANDYTYTVGLEPFILAATMLTLISSFLFIWAWKYNGTVNTHVKGHLLQVQQQP